MEPTNSKSSTEVTEYPLTVPEQLWVLIPEDQKEVLRHADFVLHAITPGYPATLRDLHERTGMELEDLIHALHALDGMDLVTVDNDGRGLTVTLVALPDEYVRFTDASGTAGWIFVTRPIVAPDVDASQLN